MASWAEYIAQNIGSYAFIIQNGIAGLITPVYNVMGYGAKGDGVTDDTGAFNVALVAASAIGGIVYVPPTTNGYVIAGVVTIPYNTSLIGSLTFPAFSPQVPQPFPKQGALLLFTTINSQIVMMCGGTNISGFTLYWPNQIDVGAPIEYPAAIAVTNSLNHYYDIHISNLYVINAYQLINAITGHGRLWISNIVGWCIFNFLFDDGSVDCDHIDHIHINPGVWADYTGTDPDWIWSNANMVGLILGRADGVFVDSYFQLGGSFGILLQQGTLTGVYGGTFAGTTYGQFSNISFDGVGSPVCINAFNGYCGLEFSNVQFAGGGGGFSIGSGVDTSAGSTSYQTITATNVMGWGTSKPLVGIYGKCNVIINGGKYMIQPGSYNAVVFMSPSTSGDIANLYMNNMMMVCNGAPGTAVDVRFYVPSNINVSSNVYFNNCQYIANGVAATHYADTSYGTNHIYTGQNATTL